MKVNILATTSSTLIGNPFLSSIPGGFVDISLENRIQINSISDPAAYRNIFLNTLGNIMGQKLGAEAKVGSTLPAAELTGASIGSTGAAVLDKLSKTDK